MSESPSGPGIVVVDKPPGMTSHDVVGRCRRIFSTRRVGHAGTLDPMATGVLVIGVERATKILGLLTAAPKSYTATIRLGQSTSTDDAEGEPVHGDRPGGQLDILAGPHPVVGSPSVDLDRRDRGRPLQDLAGQRGQFGSDGG